MKYALIFSILVLGTTQLYAVHSGLGEYSNFIFVQIKTGNAGDAIASARLSNVEMGKNKKIDEVPNFFGLSISTYSSIAGTIRRFSIDSELVVFGQLEKKMEPNDSQEARITLQVKEILKGKISDPSSQIQINLSRCHYKSADYIIGNKIIVFLKKDKKDHSLKLFHHELGKIDKQHIIPIYKERIKEIIAIETIPDTRQRMRLTIDWSIRCMSNPITRREGTQELSRHGFLYRFDKEKKQYVRRKHSRLTRKQRETIRSLLLNTKILSYNDSYVIELIAKKKDSEMIDFTLKQLDLFDRSKIIWYRELNLMRTIVQLSGRKDLEKILLEIKETKMLSRSKRLNELTEAFIQQV